MPKAIIQDWIESERGWGTRPDGWSLHLSLEDLVDYNDEAWKKQDEYFKSQGVAGVPDEYSRPIENSIRDVIVSQEIYDDLWRNHTEGKKGLRLWQTDRAKLEEL